MTQRTSELAIRFEAPAASTSSRAARTPRLVFPDGYYAGRSAAMTALHEEMRTLSRGSLPVLIHGETGVGKEWIARILHRSSDRAAGPFVALNCAALPHDLLEAEMFGIGKGIATGVERRAGVFQQAASGTLLLDEIGEMAPALQAKLLRALQEKEVRPIGGQPLRIDVRIVAATNVDLEPGSTSRVLRQDLYFRLAGGVLEVPPLRHRRDDIPGLVSCFLRRFAREAGIWLRGVTAAAIDRLSAHSWPGNVRELEHEMRRLVYHSGDGAIIDADALDRRIRAPRKPDPRMTANDESLALAPRIAALERRLIREALRRTGGRQIEAARLLEISRNGLAKKLRRLDLKDSWAMHDDAS